MLLRRSRGAAVAAALCVAVAGAYAACSDSPGAHDAGTDAGDAGGDGPRDAGPHDAGHDASVELDPGWVSLEGFRAECPHERATNPAPLIDVRWEPCPFDPDSCTYLARDERYYRRYFSEDSAYHDGTRGYFAIGQTIKHDDDTLSDVQVVADSEGRVYAGWRDHFLRNGFASLGHTTVGGGRVAHLAECRGPRPDTELLYGPIRLYWSDLESAPEGEHLALVMREDDIVPPGNAIYWAQTSESLVALRFDGTGQVLLFDGTRWVKRGGRLEGGRASRPRIVGDDVFWGVFRTGIMTASMEREPTIVVEDDVYIATPAEGVLFWQRVAEYTEGVSAVDPWISPLTTDPAAVEARQVGPRFTGSPHSVALNDGLYAYNQQEQSPPYVTSIYVVDLADGSRRRYDLPTGAGRWNTNFPLWITRDEVALYGQGFLPDGSRVEGTLIRVRLSAFVPDEPPP